MVYLIWLKQFIRQLIFKIFHIRRSNLTTSIILEQASLHIYVTYLILEGITLLCNPWVVLKNSLCHSLWVPPMSEYFLCLTILSAISDWCNIHHALSPLGNVWARSAVRADYCSLLLRLLCSIQSLHTTWEHLSRDEFISLYFCNKSSIHLQSLPSFNSFLVKEILIFWLMHLNYYFKIYPLWGVIITC